MSAENAIKFEGLLRDDEALRAKLEQAVAAYTGDKSDERAFFDAVLVPLAEEAGLPHTFDDVKEAKESHELDEAELAAVAGGGWGFCFIIGASDHSDAACYIPGYACAFFGVGVGGKLADDQVW